MTTTAKADSLFNLGYRAEPCGSYLLVTTPTGRIYRLDPARNTCSCPASVTCKHLCGWWQLLNDEADAVCWQMNAVDTWSDECWSADGREPSPLGRARMNEQVRLSERAWRLRLAADALLAVGVREERIAA